MKKNQGNYIIFQSFSPEKSRSPQKSAQKSDDDNEDEDVNDILNA